jgi:hypothetical protein
MEERLAFLGVSFLPLTGKDSVIEVWKGLPGAHRWKAFFIVDQDSWVYVGMPKEYVSNDLETTSGYSIENDLLEDGDLLELCTPAERAMFDRELEIVCRWHARRVAKIAQGADERIRDHPNQILNVGAPDISTEPKDVQTWYLTLLTGFSSKLRGKTLMQLLIRQLSASNREAKHSYNSLIEVAAVRPRHNLSRIESSIQSYFNS